MKKYLQNLGFGPQPAAAPTYSYSEPDDNGSYAPSEAPMGAVIAGDPRKRKKDFRDRYKDMAMQFAMMSAQQPAVQHHQFRPMPGLLQ